MPVVSVNLSDNAYEVYRMWRDHGRSASQKVSQAICRLWDGEDGPVLQPGDRRTSVTGDKIVWTEGGWKMEEDNSNEAWMKKQKEMNE
jgi:hypothetical protein